MDNFVESPPTLDEFRAEIYRVRLESVRLKERLREHEQGFTRYKTQRLKSHVFKAASIARRWRELYWNLRDNRRRMTVKHSKEILEQLVARALDYD